MSTGKRFTLNRILAKFIDLAVMMLLATLLQNIIGPLLGFFYSILADGFHFKNFQGVSLGKKVFGLEVFHVLRNEPAGYKDSIIRNLPVGVVTFFSIVPVWGWIFMIIIGVPLFFIEVYLMFRIENGRRLGDVMADTVVRMKEQS